MISIDALSGATILNFFLSWIALFILLKCRNIGKFWLPVFFWLVHQTIFVSVVFVLRAFGLYEGPSVLFTAWSSIVRMHVLITIVFLPYVMRKG